MPCHALTTAKMAALPVWCERASVAAFIVPHVYNALPTQRLPKHVTGANYAELSIERFPQRARELVLQHERRLV